MRNLLSSTASLTTSFFLLLAAVQSITPVVAHGTTLRETGISTGATLLGVGNAALNYRMRDIHNMGAKWVRVDFNWGLVQPRNHSDYNWAQYDRVVHAAAAHDLKILGTLAYSPVWARNVACQAIARSDKCSPRSTEEFARFARASVLRYKSQGVHAWEIWNEENLTGYWKTVRPNKSIGVDPAAFARLANDTAKQIRLNDRLAFVLTGGLAPMFDPQSPAGMRQSDYLAKLLAQLNPSLFNGVGIHPYSWPKLPGLAANYNAFYTVNHGGSQYNLQAIMAHAGWGDKQIWATEFGASTKGRRLATNAPIRQGARPDHVTETLQAQIIQQGISQWFDKSNVGPIFVHSDSDRWLPERKNEGGFGLRREDNSQKPSYGAFKRSAAQTTL